MKEHNEIDSLFESAFDGLTLTPDASVKENIDQAIASKKKRRRFLFILFPVLFGVVGFAATLYFYPFSERTTQEKAPSAQNEKPILNRSGLNETRSDQSRRITTIKPNQSPNTANSSIRKVRVKKSGFKTTTSSIVAKSSNQPKSKTTLLVNRQAVSFNEEISPKTGIEKTNFQTESTPKNPESTGITQQDTLIVAEVKKDSTLANNSTDSANTTIPEITSNGLANKHAGKWSLAVLTYWEGEKKREIGFRNEPFVNNKRELASIHSSTFYGKIEINYAFTRRWEVLTGVGFRSSKIVQYGIVNKIKLPLEDLGSGIPNPINPPVPDTVLYKHVQSFRVNSLVLPLGFAYSFPFKHNIRLRLAAGADFAFGHFARETLNKELSAPMFRPFGCSVWVRPELYYSFGKMELFGFGTFNQTFSQQLRWDFEPRRNPAFGGGIGLRIQL